MKPGTAIRSKNRCRKGAASLEFVLSLPFLLFIFVSAWSVGKVVLEKNANTITIRRELWQQRTDPMNDSDELNETNFIEDQALSVTSGLDPTTGMLSGEIEGNVRVVPWLGGSASPIAKTAIIVRTWDHEQVDFDGTKPHFEVMAEMAVGNISGLVNGFSRLLGAMF